MADSYSFNVRISLPDTLPADAQRIIDFMLNGKGSLPPQLPSHHYFGYAGALLSPSDLVPKGAPWITTSFQQAPGFGSFATVSLLGVKGTDAYYRVLLLVDWMVGFSEVDQIVGTAANLASPETCDLLTCKKGALYITPEIQSSTPAQLVNPADH